MRHSRARDAFTLLELSVVAGIVAVVGTILLVVINPAELLKQSHDATRLAQAAELNKAISIYRIDREDSGLGDPQTVYISIPDPNANPTSDCGSIAGLPTLPVNWDYQCVSDTALSRIDGTGWLPLDFTSLSSASPLGELPIDPVNDAPTGLYYAYIGGTGYLLVAPVESERYRGEAAGDGGIDDSRLELGSDLDLWAAAQGIIAYWKLDEGSGTSIGDISPNDNNGTIIGTPQWTTGKVNGALNIDSGTYVKVIDSTSLDFSPGVITVEAWVKRTNTTGDDYVLTKAPQTSSGPDGLVVPYNLRITDNSGTNGIAEFRLCIDAGSNCGTALATGPTLVKNRWYHLVGTFDQAVGNLSDNRRFEAIKIYVDGVVRGSGPMAGTDMKENNDPLLIGRFRTVDSLNVMRGVIDEIRLYNRVLSDAEILARYNEAQ